MDGLCRPKHRYTDPATQEEKVIKRSAVAGLVFAAIIAVSNIRAEEPWSISAEHPVTNDVIRRQQPQMHRHGGMSAYVFRFFQKYISPLDGATCYYRPTCSLYATRAVQKYGVIGGTIMGFDRLIRCHNSQTESRFDPPVHY